LEDISVPRPQLSKAAEAIEKISEKHSLLIGTFGHAGDGNLHPTIVLDKDDADEVRRAERSLSDIFNLALELGGTITGEHGVGSAKLPYLRAKLGDVSLSLHHNIKSVFDPDRILNPGRLGT
jgi:glycolate oxidase